MDSGAAVPSQRTQAPVVRIPRQSADVSTAIIHVVAGSEPASASVTAPGWVPAARVLDAAGLPAARTVPSVLPWSDWVRTHPVIVHAPGLPLLPASTPTPVGHVRLLVRAGPESGFAIALPQGEWTVSRGAGADVELADPYLSRQPLALSNGPSGIRVGDRWLAPAGLWAPQGGPVSPESTPHVLGSTTLELSAPPCQAAATNSVSTAERPSWPEPAEVADVRTPSWIVYVAPLAIGMALALLVGTWWFLLLSLAGPATAALSLRAERRRHARESAQAAREHRAAIAATLAQLDARLQSFVHALIATAYGAVRSPVRDDPTNTFVVGTGRLITPVGVRLPRDRHARARALRRLPPHCLDGDIAWLTTDSAPLLLGSRTTVRVRGPEARVREIVRALVAAHVAAGSGCRAGTGFPEFAGLRSRTYECVVEQDEPRGRPADGSSNHAAEACITVHGPRTALGPPTMDDAVVEIRCSTSGRADHIQLPDLAAGRFSRIGGAASAPDEHRGTPQSGNARIHALTATTFLRLLATIGPPRAAIAHPLPAATAIPTTAVPDVLRLWDAAGRPGAGPLAVPIGHATARPTPPAGSPGLSSAAAGSLEAEQPSQPFVLLDLRASGPHALVAGTTGSGKSVLLEAWLDGLCRTHAAAELRLVLLDFKGGASLSRFLTRTHTDCVITDLDEAAALRAVRSITAEITRRERRLAAAGCRDLDELLERARTDPSVAPLPRLLVVIDEFHVLASLSPHVVTAFERLTAVGRSLGVHIVLATQRPSGVVSARMRANISLRICLRVRDDADSREVLGIPDASWIDARAPGAALISDDSGVRAVRSTVPEDAEHTPSGPPHATFTSLTDPTTEVVQLDCAPPPLPSLVAGPAGPRHEVIAAPLPARVTADDPRLAIASPIPARSDVERASRAHAIGLIDLPDENRVAAARIGPTSGSVTVSGGRGRGWTTAVDTLALAFHTAGLPVVHLSPHGGLPAVDAHGILRLGHEQAWLIDHLMDVCSQRREPVVWAIDDWDEFVDAQQPSARVDRLERLLTGSAGMRFVVSGHRRQLAQRLAQAAATRVIFPPAADADAVFFGLQATRFSGEWPPGRAVVLGEGSLTDDHGGADLQIALPPVAPLGTPVTDRPAHPLWTDFTEPARPPARERARPIGAQPRIRIGTDPAGTPVLWDPVTDGAVLTVHRDGSAQAVTSPEISPLAELEDALSSQGVTVVSDVADAQQRAAADVALSADRPVCLVESGSCPLVSRTGAESRGPHLLTGEWRYSALRATGLRTCAPIPAAAAASWWMTEGRAVPVRVGDQSRAKVA